MIKYKTVPSLYIAGDTGQIISEKKINEIRNAGNLIDVKHQYRTTLSIKYDGRGNTEVRCQWVYIVNLTAIQQTLFEL